MHLTIAADTLAAGTVRLDAALTKLGQAVDTAAATSKDVTAARAEIASAVAGVGAARSLAGGISDAVQPLVPAGYPANASVVIASRAKLTEARAKLRASVIDAKEARGLLAA